MLLNEFHKNRTQSDGLQRTCKQCSKRQHAKYWENVKPEVRERSYDRSKNYRKTEHGRKVRNAGEKRRYTESASLREHVKEQSTLWAMNNKEKRLEANRKYNRSEKGRVCYLRLYATNRHKYILKASLRAKRIHEYQTPSWADMEKIAEIYQMAGQITKETGVLHHVDHIIPLNHDKVCGLHVENNLRVITAQENWAKQNKFVPEIRDLWHFQLVNIGRE